MIARYNLPTEATLILPAPAKLNLFLHIIGRRADGYHNLQTIFQFLDYADYLAFSPRNDGVIQLNTPILGVAHNDNLIVKAAKLLQSYTHSYLGADIWLDKKLPVGGGLGGGSSNAATTLLALNQLWKTGLSISQLSQLGIRLGADIPVFIVGKAAFAEGIGEQLRPIKLAEPWFLVATPPVSISTASIFNDPELTRDTPAIDYQQASSLQGHNDCQAIVTKHYPLVKEALQWMNQLAPSKLTGTGACLFSSFDSQQQALTAQQQLTEKLVCFVAKGANTSMLHRSLNAVD